MLGRSKRVIFLNKGKLTAVEVVDPSAKRFGKVQELSWTLSTLELSLSEVAKSFNSKDFLVVVSDELCYVVRIKIPPGIDAEKTREYVLGNLTDKVPDQVDEGEWDFRLLKSKTSQDHDALAFVLVKSFAKSFFESTIKLGLKIEAIEPEVVSKTRDINPYIGICMKEDIHGKDEDVLNITPTTVVPLGDTKPIDPASAPNEDVNLPSNSKKNKLIIVLLLGILAGTIAGGIIYFRKNLMEKKEELISPVPPSQAPSLPNPTQEPITPEEVVGELENINLKTLNLQVQNGSGTPGEAGYIAGILRAEGFEIITTGNAGSFNLTDTTIRTKSTYKPVFQIIENALDEYNIKEGEEIADSGEFDVVVIVGKRKQ